MAEGHNKIKVFFLEDNPDDVELEIYELKKAGIAVKHDVARNRREFIEKLPGFDADIILADFSLPDITGVDAIGLCRDMNIDLPVILITGAGNEMIAVDSLRMGAVDYILKKNIAGLPARVLRALEIWADKKAKERAEAEEKRLLQVIFENQKMESIGRLAGGIAHDFNNILAGIMGYSELCLGKLPRGSDIFKKLQTIITLSARGADLVKQLLIFSRKMPMEFKTVDINSFIADTVNFLKRMVEETIDIRVELQEGIPNIKCDTGKFMQALMNLVLNARDAMDGRGVISVRTEKCFSPGDIPAEKSEKYCGEYAVVSVSDSGSGIDKNNLPKIFEPFFTTKETGKGTGLGLAIVYSVVKAHNGHIKVFSEKGAGTIFKIYLPIETDAPDSHKQYARESTKKDLSRISGNETILIAEDEEMLRALIDTALHSLGYNVISAENGDDALQKYKANAEKIDIVISDMLMPEKNGIELFKELKAINPSAKFILVTGYSLAGQDEKILAEIDAVLSKPYMPMDIARLIRDIIDG